MCRKNFLLAALVILFVVGCGKKEPEVIKIGAILPLTGDLAVYGQKMKNGIDFALSRSQEGVPLEYRIEVMYEDDRGDPKTSVAGFQKLISVEKVPIVIGGAISSCALAVAPIADKEKVVLFSPAATSPKLTGISSYFFRNWPSDVYEGSIMADFVANNLKITQISVLYVNNDWGLGILKAFKERFQKHSGSLLVEESFSPGTTDFRSQWTKIKKSNPLAVYVIGYIKELLPLLKQKKEMGIKVQILSSSGFYDEQILQQEASAVSTK
ncbi:MAG: ABC transporter substrate-binding protein [Bacteroidota bacterium]|nr:ABC transporter substrate-binding protein [Bacteroidota bacterium]